MGNPKTHQNNNKGITLLVLITTIIILLILAGVALSLVLGEEGIINRAITASKTYDISGAKEQVEFLVATYSGNYYEQKYTTGNESVEDSMVEYVIARFKENEGENIGEYDVSVDEEDRTVTIKSTKYEDESEFAIIKEDGSVVWGKGDYIDTEKSYVGYYADLTGTGKIDGVIYADLAKGRSGRWYSGYDAYSIPKVNSEELKKYYVSQTDYDGPFGKKDVLSPIGEKKDRFYVMALSDFTTDDYTSFLWYGNWDERTSECIPIGSFGKGRSNTNFMIEKWNREKDNNANPNPRDIWPNIQEKAKQVNGGWFVPSVGEWAAFACMFKGDDKITIENYSNIYGLSANYWTSTIHHSGASIAWFALFPEGQVYYQWLHEPLRVRLSTTF